MQADETAVLADFLRLQRAVAGRYSLIRELGRGGMATVFLARDVALDRLVAVKLLRKELVADPAARARFLAEARTAAGLVHPNIVPVHAVEEVGDLVFLVMAFVEGESLGRRVRRAGPLTPMGVRQVVRELAWALSRAHEAGVVHLDVKPDNILLERDSGRAMLADFGIARLARQASEGSPENDRAGTPRYMSPEHLAGAPVDGRSDLYSLGVTAYFALTARWPKGPGDAAPTGAPPRLAEAIRRCLARDPGKRPRSAMALAEEIAEAEALPFHLPVAGRRLVRGVRQLVIVLVAGSVPLVLWSGPGLFAAAVITSLLLGELLGPARSLGRQGYDAALLRDVICEEVHGLFTERVARGSSWWERVTGRLRNAAIRWAPAIVGLGAAGLVVLRLLLPETPLGGALAAFALLSGLLLGAGPDAKPGSPVRNLDWAERLLVGRFGRVLLPVAGVGLGTPRSSGREFDQPTEVLLASAAESLFRELPVEVRERLGDLPQVARELERQVEDLRRRDTALAEAASRVEIPAGKDRDSERHEARVEMEEARAALDERLRSAVAALEHLRLSLYRLASDATRPQSVEAVKTDLRRARELGAGP